MTTTEIYFQSLANRIGEICRARNWNKDWSGGGCYIHLEVSEFIEALRGKGGDPKDEAADVIITLLAVLDHYDIGTSSVLDAIEAKLDKLEAGTIGRYNNA